MEAIAALEDALLVTASDVFVASCKVVVVDLCRAFSVIACRLVSEGSPGGTTRPPSENTHFAKSDGHHLLYRRWCIDVGHYYTMLNCKQALRRHSGCLV